MRCAFCYCSGAERHRFKVDANAILRCVLAQLLAVASSTIHSQLIEDLKMAYSLENELSLKDVTNMIIRFCKKDTYRVFIFIDGLTECLPRTQELLLEALDCICTPSTGIVKIFVSSTRLDIAELRPRKSSSLTLTGQEGEEEIKRYIRTTLAEFPLQLLPELKEDSSQDGLVNEVGAKAGGKYVPSFSLANIVIPSLITYPTLYER